MTRRMHNKGNCAQVQGDKEKCLLGEWVKCPAAAEEQGWRGEGGGRGLLVGD